MIDWYKTGSIALTPGSPVVTGSGTSWLANVQRGEALLLSDGRYVAEITEVINDATMTLAAPWTGTALTGQPYSVLPAQGYLRDVAARAAEVIAQRRLTDADIEAAALAAQAADHAASAAQDAAGQAGQAAGAAADDAAALAAQLAAFRNVFLGAHASDGAAESYAATHAVALSAGVMYWNTTGTRARIHNGADWEDYDDDATASQAAAALSASQAAGAASAAQTAAGQAAAYRDQADGHAQGAAASAAAAQTARAGAEAAQQTTTTGIATAQAAAQTAGTASTAAEAAQAAAQTARDQAATYANNAAGSAGQAQAAAAQANDRAHAAGQAASDALTQRQLADEARQAAEAAVRQFPDGGLGAPGISFVDDPDTGIRRTASGTFRMVSNGADVAEIGSTGISALGALRATSSGSVIRAISTSARGSGSNYLEYSDPSGLKGYVGYASGSHDHFSITNALGEVRLNSAAGSAWLDVAGNILVGSGTHISDDGFGRLVARPGVQIGNAPYAGLYGVALTYLAKYDGGWKSLGGGTASALSIDEGILSFCTSQGVGDGDQSLNFVTRLGVINGALLVGTVDNGNNYRAVFETNASTNGVEFRDVAAGGSSAVGFTSRFNQGASTGFAHFSGVAGGAEVYVVQGNGDVRNTNNSYGAISDLKLKQDIDDAKSQWADIKALRVRKYRLKADPAGPLMMGLVAQEAEAISPGLIETADDYEDAVIEPARTEVRIVQRQKMQKITVEQPTPTLVNGLYVLRMVATEIDVPLIEEHPLFAEDGSPVLEIIEPEQPEQRDEEGNIVTPAKPAVTRQAVHRVPVMEDVEEAIEIPAKIERRPTGTQTKSVKYSILYMKAVKALQEAMERIEVLEADVAALKDGGGSCA